MRTKEAFEYKKDAEEKILQFVSLDPKTTNDISKEVKEKFFSKIHPKTVERLLNNLQDQGKIKGNLVGRIKVWQLN